MYRVHNDIVKVHLNLSVVSILCCYFHVMKRVHCSYKVIYASSIESEHSCMYV